MPSKLQDLNDVLIFRGHWRQSPDVSNFRDKGVEYADSLNALLEGTTVIRDAAWAPSQGSYRTTQLDFAKESSIFYR